jgi:hypothetical protein
VVVVALAASAAGPAHAEPQANAGLRLGGAAVGEGGAFWDHAELHLGAHGDLILGRSRATDFGVGPYLALGTLAFDELDLGSGLSLLLPVHDSFPIVVSGGFFGRVGDDGFGFEPGVAGALFWGSRSYNFHAHYVMSVGLSLGYALSLGDSRESSLLLAAHLDAVALALPFVALAHLIRGPSREAAPIE